MIRRLACPAALLGLALAAGRRRGDAAASRRSPRSRSASASIPASRDGCRRRRAWPATRGACEMEKASPLRGPALPQRGPGGAGRAHRGHRRRRSPIPTRSWWPSPPAASGAPTTAAGAGRRCSTASRPSPSATSRSATPDGAGPLRRHRREQLQPHVLRRAPASSRRTDGGRTWRNVGLTDSHHIGRVLVDRARPATSSTWPPLGHLYTENAERGVYKSTDGGETWTRVLFVDERTGAIDLVQDPTPARGALRRHLGARAHGRGTSWRAGRAAASGSPPTPGAPGRAWPAGCPPAPPWAASASPSPAARPETRLRRHRQPVPAAGDGAPRRGHAARRAHRAAPARAVRGGLRAASTTPSSTRFLRAQRLPQGAQGRAPLKRDVKAGKITVADLVAYLQDANRDLFEREIVGPEVYRSDDGGRDLGAHARGPAGEGLLLVRLLLRPHQRRPHRRRAHLLRRRAPARLHATAARPGRGLDQRGVHVDHHVAVRRPARAQPRWPWATTAASTSPSTTARPGPRSTTCPSASSRPSPSTTPSPTTSWAACRTTA